MSEISDAQSAADIFNSVWSHITDSQSPAFPQSIYWLNGGPGAGKGTQTHFIQSLKNFAGTPIVISDILQSPEAKAIKDSGKLVGDHEVFSLLLQNLTHPDRQGGVIVDGFPRTQTQVEILKLLSEKLPNTDFHIVVLHIDEPTSVQRQLHRGKSAQSANQQGGAQPVEIRKTDLDPDLAALRYKTFINETFTPLTSLENTFPYHFISAAGSIEEVQSAITQQLS